MGSVTKFILSKILCFLHIFWNIVGCAWCIKIILWDTFYRSHSNNLPCKKSVCIWSFPGPYFPTFGVNMERYNVSLCNQSKCWKIWTRKLWIRTLFMQSFRLQKPHCIEFWCKYINKKIESCKFYLGNREQKQCF